MEKFTQGGSLVTTVLFRASTPQFEKSYAELQTRHPGVTWVAEVSFGEQLRAAVATAHPHVLLCCDDSLYYNKFDLGEAARILDANPHVIVYHIMLHGGLSYCQPKGKESPPPPLMPGGGSSMTFVRMMASLEWNYPWELSSSLYRKADVEAMLEAIVKHHGEDGISHPNKLEECGERVAHSQQCEPFTKAMCACSSQAVASAVVINR